MDLFSQKISDITEFEDIFTEFDIAVVRSAELDIFALAVDENRHLGGNQFPDRVIHDVESPGELHLHIPLAAHRPDRIHDIAVTGIFVLHTVSGKTAGRDPFDEFHVAHMADQRRLSADDEIRIVFVPGAAAATKRRIIFWVMAILTCSVSFLVNYFIAGGILIGVYRSDFIMHAGIASGAAFLLFIIFGFMISKIFPNTKCGTWF